MRPGTAAALLGGAVVGALGVILTLFSLVAAVDERWVTRREYNEITRRLERIERKIDQLEDARVPRGGRAGS